jgi:hypothetical protein
MQTHTGCELYHMIHLRFHFKERTNLYDRQTRQVRDLRHNAFSKAISGAAHAYPLGRETMEVRSSGV